MAANMECPSPNTGLQDFSFSKTQFNKKMGKPTYPNSNQSGPESQYCNTEKSSP